MLVKLGETWVDPAAIEAIAPYGLAEQPACQIYLSSPRAVIIRGLSVAQVVDLIREAVTR